MKVVTYNVNGIRSAMSKGFIDFVKSVLFLTITHRFRVIMYCPECRNIVIKLFYIKLKKKHFDFEFFFQNSGDFILGLIINFPLFKIES